MSKLSNRTLSPKGRRAVGAAIGLTNTLALQLNTSVRSPSIVIEVCLREVGELPVTFHTSTVQHGSPDMPSPDEVLNNLHEYGRLLALKSNITAKQLTQQEAAASDTLDITTAGHYIISLSREIRVLVLVAGPPAKLCRMYARFAAAGIALAAHQIT